MTEQYIYTRRAHSAVERAHLITSDTGTRVETRCGLDYEKRTDFMGEYPPDELPELVCRNCRRSLRAE